MLDLVVKLALPWASNRYVNHLLGRVAPETCFRLMNAWPGGPFPWTDRKVAVCLSFDCDSPEDADAIAPLLESLKPHGFPASYALVGELVEQRPDAYKRLLESNNDILNHGYSCHVEELPQGGYKPILFYDSLSWDRIEQEISVNQECLERVLGVRPKGFRTPHFGGFQAPDQIEGLFGLLTKYGMSYSSSTLVWNAKSHKYLSDQTVLELPVSARVGPPISYFDSWTMVVGVLKQGGQTQLFQHWKRALDVALKRDTEIFLNVYFDPSHVVDNSDFKKCVSYLASLKDEVWVGTYRQIAHSIGALGREIKVEGN